MPAKDIRGKMKTLMEQTLRDEAANYTWSYHAVRPMYVPASWAPGQHVVGDCSKGVQYLCKWAGAPDPMAAGFGPNGNSQTIWLHAQHVDYPSELAVGDVVTFGISGSDHAAMVMEAGADPLLWSFGHQGAPNSYRLSWDRRVHQLCRLPIAKYVPTPQDRLRARTGWFAWVAWKLGEGDWIGYGPANKNVRPDVPKVISPLWWRMYTAFLLNRNKANAASAPIKPA